MPSGLPNTSFLNELECLTLSKIWRPYSIRQKRRERKERKSDFRSHVIRVHNAIKGKSPSRAKFYFHHPHPTPPPEKKQAFWYFNDLLHLKLIFYSSFDTRC